MERPTSNVADIDPGAGSTAGEGTHAIAPATGSEVAFRLLLSGIDTVECAYYLRGVDVCAVDFARLTALREELRLAKVREPAVVELGDASFLLHPYGSASGYPLVMSNADFHVQFGERNNPSFFVKFLSAALWRDSALGLHQRFLAWAESVGLHPVRWEGLSRVDWSFDYYLPEIDFDEDGFVSLSVKDAIHREDRKAQTFSFGTGEVVLRVYDKVAEIGQRSGKTWFFRLWGCSENVWRIEFQVRKGVLRRFGVRTFADLEEGQGDVLRYLASEHDSLRVPNDDANRSRWPLHPLWADLQARIAELPGLGVYREIDTEAAIEERLTRIAMSVYGYYKRVAALYRLRHGAEDVTRKEAAEYLERFLARVHDPLSWKLGVDKRTDQMRLGQW